ncbi:DUF4097 family beta strand repeat-containing protein [Parapedobacter sp. 10938]|uniref:DUF4097 family beta strand repeat-containing protein n=1 Tax=Parapedobacter flavus TaxID=3110225 RepID=UPI002DB739E3|nr:DUF4097 family beta strand repeat-containing protein [Parapedobacter sp. 10938]MEC3879980.1 DUF4097 family beta strand repeat-containing protein [Parapedobacter sp. 10938]
MKKQTIIMALLLALCLPAWAQKEYRIDKPSGKLYLNLNGARIEGYTGNEIVFSNQGVPEEEDERAKGLQALSSSGFIDNTGLGISVTKKGNDIEVNPVGNNSRGDVLYVRVPKTVDIVFNNNKSVFADTLLIKNMKGEIEVSSSYNDIVLENNSGPMNIKNVYKNIEVTFAHDIKGPISIISVYGHVDVAMPASTKTNLTMSTSYGKLYAAGDFNVAITPQAMEKRHVVSVAEVDSLRTDVDEELAAALDSMPDMVIVSPPSSGTGVSIATMFRDGIGENIKGTINGGGIDLILKSTYKNVYLRTN